MLGVVRRAGWGSSAGRGSPAEATNLLCTYLVNVRAQYWVVGEWTGQSGRARQ